MVFPLLRRSLLLGLLVLGGCDANGSAASPSGAGASAQATVGGAETTGGGGQGGVSVTTGGSAGTATGGTVVPGGGAVNGGGAAAGAGGASGGAAVGAGAAGLGGASVGGAPVDEPSPRLSHDLNAGWRFTRNDPQGAPNLSYEQTKQWVLPTSNRFLPNASDHAARPAGDLDGGSYSTAEFDDSSWTSVTLPHDYAIEGPFTNNISSSMGRLPSPGASWYRRAFTLPAEDAGKSVFLDIDGAMQYSLVWLNGAVVGGWPYGYTSFRLDLTDFARFGQENVIAIRLSTPTPKDAEWDSGSSRWYPGAGIYRDVRLITTASVHVGHWGTQVTTPNVSAASASVNLAVSVDNDSDADVTVTLISQIYELDAAGARTASPVATIESVDLSVPANANARAQTTGAIPNPKLWGVPPTQQPNRYMAYTRLVVDNKVADAYETPFGVRTISFDGEGFVLNGERIKMDGVCLHHDLGALGAATNLRARERQLEILQEMGTNAIRTAHNPFEPGFFELADRMGFLVMDEAFDVWREGKAVDDHHVFFDDWHEQDLRALIRRDRNHPSVVLWSIGNEIVEQKDETNGPALGAQLNAIVHEEDATRPTIAGMNSAQPSSPFSGPIDTIGLNYQGTGIRDRGAQYPTYHSAFPDKFIVGTETTSTFSTRGTYLFPVTASIGTPASGSEGIDTKKGIISSYDLYHADWSYSPDEEFASQDNWTYVGGEFVWTGFDYLGEPTPLDAVARSSYFGIIDLAGFKKDRFYLYQARWRPDLAMAHLLPHWTWPGREGQVTPVHVYTSGDSAELFINDVSQGMKRRGQNEYRLRWDDVVYKAGTLRVVAYKGGAEWATDTVETAGAATQLSLAADRAVIRGDGVDLSYLTATVLDDAGRLVPQASNSITFAVSGPGELVATDNGDPTDRDVFSSNQRRAYSGMALAIVRSAPSQSGEVVVTARGAGLTESSVTITVGH